MNKGRVVITGVGVVSPIGIGKEQFWQALFAGKSGIKPITLFDTAGLKVRIGGEITEFNPKSILGSQGLMDLDRATLILLSAGKLALDDAHLQINENNTHRIGVSIGTTFGSLNSISKFDQEAVREGPRYANPSVFPSTVGNSPASRLNIRFGIKGFSSTLSTGMCAALDALDYACNSINFREFNVILSGAVEDFNMQLFIGLYKLNCLSGLNGTFEPLSCPFDRRRNGIIFSEGATVLILEDLDSALIRKATIYAEILGIASSFDPVKFYTYDPKGEGMSEAMRLTLEYATLKPQDIDCIFAHANSTQDTDAIETKAIKKVFGDYAYKVPVTAIKSMIGETFSAAGGLATVAAIGALSKNLIPPTINYQEKDSACDLDYVVNKSWRKELQRIMINAFDPNGANTTVIIGKFKEDH